MSRVLNTQRISLSLYLQPWPFCGLNSQWNDALYTSSFIPSFFQPSSSSRHNPIFVVRANLINFRCLIYWWRENNLVHTEEIVCVIFRFSFYFEDQNPVIGRGSSHESRESPNSCLMCLNVMSLFICYHYHYFYKHSHETEHEITRSILNLVNLEFWIFLNACYKRPQNQILRNCDSSSNSCKCKSLKLLRTSHQFYYCSLKC